MFSSREQLAVMTKDRVMQALAALMRGGANVTFELLANRSGVPLRTLYRHFSSREVLLGAFWEWVNRHVEMPPLPETPEEIVSHISALFAAYDRDEPLIRAMIHDPHGRAVFLDKGGARRESFSKALMPILDALPAPEARGLAVSVTVLCSPAGWESMKDNWRFTGVDAAAAAQWAVRSLIEEARRRIETGPPAAGEKSRRT